MSDFTKLKTKKNGKEYILNACTQDTEQNITGTKNFTKLTVNSKNVVTSINGISPSEDGNVLLGTEKSTFNKVEYDTGYFSITTAKTYSFDLTGSDLENVSKENVNIRLIAKVVTTHGGFEVGDIAQLTTTVDHAYKSGDLDVCSYIRGNTLYVYSGDNLGFSINSGTGWVKKPNVQIKAVLTAFVPDDGSILLIAEDQNNTSKLIGLPDGTLTWGGKNIVRSVNGINADNAGNVTIPTSLNVDYSAGISISISQNTNQSYTAPTNGILIGTLDNSNTISYFSVNGIKMCYVTAWNTPIFQILNKGDKASWRVESTESLLTFYPFK